MKKVLILLVAVALFFGAFGASVEVASAASNERTGIVTSTRVSVRKEMDTDAERVASLKNGEVVTILSETGEWYKIATNSSTGYVLKKYIKSNPYYIKLDLAKDQEVTLWSDPFGTGVANGSKMDGAKLLVLSETADWYVVQTCEDSAGSSFVKKADLVKQNQQGSTQQNQTGSAAKAGDVCVVFANTLAVRVTADDEQEPIGYLHEGDLVTVVQWGDYFTSIQYRVAGQITECWVHTQWLKKVIK